MNVKIKPNALDKKYGRTVPCLTFLTPKEAELLETLPLLDCMGLEESAGIRRRGHPLRLALDIAEGTLKRWPGRRHE